MADFLEAAPRPPSDLARWLLVAFIVIFMGLQIFVPLRHLLYPGSPSWTEEGHKFSWQMKLRDKHGFVMFYVRDPETGEEWRADPEDYLFPHQERKVAARPELILQFAWYLEWLWQEERGYEDVEVRVESCVSLNGRPAQWLVDPERDLTEVSISWAPADWILPLDVPFERPPNRTHRRRIRCL